MKSQSLTLPALLLAALTACGPLSAPEATPTPTATPAATAEPTPTPTAAPTPTPDPSAGLEYEMLTLPTTPQPPHLYDGQFLTRDETQTERSNGYALIEGLYTNDADKLRGALSDSLLDSGLPLPDLTGLVITDIFLAGGTYDVPMAALTIADPGAIGLPTGNHEFHFSFDEEGKVDGFSMLNGDLQGDAARSMGLEPGVWVSLGSLGVTDTRKDNVYLTSATRVVGRKRDALGFAVEEVRAFSITERTTYDGDNNLVEYTMTSCEEVSGNWPMPQDRNDWYTQPPTDNCLSDAQLQSVTDQLNPLFAQLRDGTYTWEWEDDPDKAVLDLWDPARPVPVEVTPDVLRSDVLQYSNPDIAPKTRVWVPLPDGCWAVCLLTEEEQVDLFTGFSFALAAPTAA